MPFNYAQKHGHTAQPLLTSVVVGVVFWIILTMAGNDVVNNPQDIRSRTSVAVLAVLKDARVPVAGGIGFLIFIWMWQVQRGEAARHHESDFMEWSAGLPQWRPEKSLSDSAGVFVPAFRVDSGEFQKLAPLSGPVEPGPAAAPLPVSPCFAMSLTMPVRLPPVQEPVPPSVPDTGGRGAAVMSLMPLQQMAERFTSVRPSSMVVAPSTRMPLAVVGSAGRGLVRASQVEIPENLGLAAITRMPRTAIERLVGEYYRRLGYNVAALGQGAERAGIDLILQRRGEILVVKCLPGETGKIAPEPVRELFALVMGEGATRGILISSGDFSRKALKFAHQKGRGRLELIDGRKLEAMLRASAAGTGLSPACPCCGGSMKLAHKKKRFGRNSISWICERAPACSGTIRQGQKPAASRALAA